MEKRDHIDLRIAFAPIREMGFLSTNKQRLDETGKKEPATLAVLFSLLVFSAHRVSFSVLLVFQGDSLRLEVVESQRISIVDEGKGSRNPPQAGLS
jgi:hypothetical protein